MKLRLVFLISLLLIVFRLNYAQLAGYELITQISIDDDVYDVGWNDDGDMFAISAASGVKIFDSNYIELYTLENAHPALSIDWNSTDNSLAIAVGAVNGQVEIWEITTSNFSLDHTIPFSGTPEKVKWSPDGLKLAVLYSTFQDISIYFVDVWDTQTWKRISTGNEVFTEASEIEWTSDSNRIFGSGISYCLIEGCNRPFRFGGIFAIEASTGNAIPGKSLGVNSAESLEVGVADIIAVGDASGITLYESTSLNQLQYYADSTGVAHLRWLSNDYRLIYANYVLTVLDCETRSRNIFGSPQLTVALAINPDGSNLARAVALSDGTSLIEIWSIPSRPINPRTPTVTPNRTTN